MKRTHPYHGSGPSSLPQNHSNGQPPLPAGPAPPLPSGGPAAAYANYGYGPITPARNANANANVPVNQVPGQWQQYPGQMSGAVSPHQMRPLQPQQQQHYRGPAAGPGPPSQTVPPQTYTPHQVQHQTPQQHPSFNAYPHYAGAASAGPPAYNHSPGAYNPSAPHLSGPQLGPPAKKPRFNQTNASAVAPNSFPHAPPNQPYGWHDPAAVQHPIAAPQLGLPTNNSTGWGSINGARGKGRPGGQGMASAPSRGRPASQNHGSMRQGSSAQRQDTNVNSNAEFAPRPGGIRNGPQGMVQASSANIMPPPVANAGQPFRRPSSSGSAHSDHQSNASRSRTVSGNSKPGFSSQNMIPVSASRGNLGIKSKTPGSDANGQTSSASKSSKAPNFSGSGAAKNSVPVRKDTRKELDGNVSANYKRTHTDFRILCVEIKELSWSWSVPNLSSGGEGSEDERHKVTAMAAEAPSEQVHTSDSQDIASSSTTVSTPEQEHAKHANDARTDFDRAGSAEGGTDSHEQQATANRNTNASAAALPPTAEAEAPKSQTFVPKKSAVEEQSANTSTKAVSTSETARLRVCFAAMANAGPEGAPTGPKAEKHPSSTASIPKIEEKDDISAKVDAGPDHGAPATLATADGDPKNDSAGNALAQEASRANETSVVTEENVDELTTKSPQMAPTQSTDPDTDEKRSEFAKAEIPSDVSVEADSKGTDTGSDPKVEEETPAKVKSETEDANGAKVSISSSSSDKGDSDAQKKPAASAKGPTPLSPNRVHITYAGGCKRLAIDAEAVKSMKICRSVHRIEIVVHLSPLTSAVAADRRPSSYIAKGVLLETRRSEQDNYTATTLSEVERVWSNKDVDQDDSRSAESLPEEAKHDDVDAAASSRNGPASELPPFFRLPLSSHLQQGAEGLEMTVAMLLDPEAPTVEAKWLKTGDLEELLAGLQRIPAVAARSAGGSIALRHHVWAGKIEVVDPDPPPSFEGMLRDWVQSSFIGGQKERRAFVNDFLSNRPKVVPSNAGTAVQLTDATGEPNVSDEDDGTSEVGKTDSVAGDSEVVQPVEVETDAERDVRIAKGFVEIATHLARGERALTNAITTPVLFRSLESGISTGIRGLEGGPAPMSWGGAAMLSIFDLGLRQCEPLLQKADATAEAVAQTWRAEIARLLMELPPSMVSKAIDSAWKDVVECQRRKSGIVPSVAGHHGNGGSAGTSRSSGPRYHHAQNNGHFRQGHGHNRGGFGNKRKR